MPTLAIATGQASGVIVIDVDVPEGERSLQSLATARRDLPPTLTARTGSGGRHLYYAAPQRHLGNAVGGLPGIEGELPGIDLRADGGYVLVPPSLHISGRRYTWCEPLDQLGASDSALPQVCSPPEWLRARERTAVTRAAALAIFTGDGSAYGLAVWTTSSSDYVPLRKVGATTRSTGPPSRSREWSPAASSLRARRALRFSPRPCGSASPGTRPVSRSTARSAPVQRDRAVRLTDCVSRNTDG